VPEIWGVTVILAIRDGHLIIEFLAPTFLPESYTFAIATPKAVDELLAAACSAPNTESLLPEPVKPWTESEKEIIKVAKRIYVLESDIPPDTIPARLMHDIDRLYKDEAAAKSKPGKRETPRAPPSWNTCDRFLKKLKALRDRGLWKGLATPPPGD
jgi:hypothetical protein